MTTILSAGVPPTLDKLDSSIDKSRVVDYNALTKAAWEQKLDAEIPISIQSPCKENNSDMKGIQRTIKNLQNDLERIKRFSNLNKIGRAHV